MQRAHSRDSSNLPLSRRLVTPGLGGVGPGPESDLEKDASDLVEAPRTMSDEGRRDIELSTMSDEGRELDVTAFLRSFVPAVILDGCAVCDSRDCADDVELGVKPKWSPRFEA